VLLRYINVNSENRRDWLKNVLAELPKHSRILDAGAGELRNRCYCEHLDYVSQDFWDTSKIDLVCDITNIPEPDASFDAILCSEVLEHIPQPSEALDEFQRLLKPGGALILTAPFASLVHFAPYHFCTGFSRYWYEHHLPKRGLKIEHLTANGDWFSYIQQEITRLGPLARERGDVAWPFAYILVFLSRIYFKLRSNKEISSADLACFGWHCIAVKEE
jgi:SAM-dependent methyltransferase